MKKAVVFTIANIDDELAEAAVRMVLEMLSAESFVREEWLIESAETFRGIQGYFVVDVLPTIKEEARLTAKAFESMVAMVTLVKFLEIQTWIASSVEEARHGLNDLVRTS